MISDLLGPRPDLDLPDATWWGRCGGARHIVAVNGALGAVEWFCRKWNCRRCAERFAKAYREVFVRQVTADELWVGRVPMVGWRQVLNRVRSSSDPNGLLSELTRAAVEKPASSVGDRARRRGGATWHQWRLVDGYAVYLADRDLSLKRGPSGELWVPIGRGDVGELVDLITCWKRTVGRSRSDSCARTWMAGMDPFNEHGPSSGAVLVGEELDLERLARTVAKLLDVEIGDVLDWQWPKFPGVDTATLAETAMRVEEAAKEAYTRARGSRGERLDAAYEQAYTHERGMAELLHMNDYSA